MLLWNKFGRALRCVVLSLGIVAALVSCSNDQALYKSEEFSVYRDHVTQGEYTAKVLSNTEMTSNYESPLNSVFSRAVEFKYSINRKDNDLPVNVNRRVIVRPTNGSYHTPIAKFGIFDADTAVVDDVKDPLESKTTVVFRLDLRDVLKSFKEKGYYIDIHGEKIVEKDFNGVYIAGGVPPLSWDFENFGDYQRMEDSDGDGIYEKKYVFNTFNPDRHVAHEWSLKEDISKYPQFTSDIPLLNALYRMALEEAKADSEKDGTWRTGQKWGGVWTRDVSYSTILGVGMIDPNRSLTSLRKKVRGGRIVQDTGSGGAWPVSSDRVVWTLAAWEVYKINGDSSWLKEAYSVISKSVEDDWKIVHDPKTGLMRGESSFLDWRKQTYPRWMDNVDIYSSKNLGTNAAHYEVYQILQQMASLLGDNSMMEVYKHRAELLKEAINKHLWQASKGFYGQYLYGRGTDVLSPKSETLGEAFTVLFDVANEERAQSVIANMPTVPYGAPCVFPQIPNIRPYHNNGIWPFVQSFYNLAAAKVGNEKALNAGLASIYRAAALFLTNKENMVADNGDFVTALNSSQMLWSISGNLSMIYKVFFGIQIDQKGLLHLNPVVPEVYKGKKRLSNLRLRNATLDIEMSGFGNQISEIYVNGKKEDKGIDLNRKANYQIKVVLDNKSFGQGQKTHLVENRFQLEMPSVEVKGEDLIWNRVEGADAYIIYCDNKVVTETSKLQYKLPKGASSSRYAVMSKSSASDLLNSYLSEPILIAPKGESKVLLKRFAKSKKVTIKGASSEMIELNGDKINKIVRAKIPTVKGQKYQLWMTYANGNGPWNTDNKCAIRSIYIDGVYVDPLVMPQRGVNEWGAIGNSNIISFVAKSNVTEVEVRFEDEDRNMNILVNQALVQDICFVRVQ
ncbi:hypothetical protein K4L44_15060 [Halosquirtibacter laminarini]|uniref:Uncharacterized protein n=1 Tax=Halosquirtibacter laminarini TaxID=3374600 RepID=A0AC61NE47_9BACT|nr:hypothetical protein K4L44_15060 [Prolixibacteraceae bacterium]